jgi:sugar-specific transcriptional regulator TrmB
MRIDRTKETLGDVTGLNDIFNNVNSIYSHIQNISIISTDKLMNDLLTGLQHELSEEIDRAILDKMVNSVKDTGVVKRYRKVLHV